MARSGGSDAEKAGGGKTRGRSGGFREAAGAGGKQVVLFEGVPTDADIEAMLDALGIPDDEDGPEADEAATSAKPESGAL
jgi:hypothetical protein